MSPTMTATTTTSTTTSTSTTLSLAAPLMHRVRFDSECVLIPDVPQPKRPRMLSKSYSLPLWRRARDRDDERNSSKFGSSKSKSRSRSPPPPHMPLPCLRVHASASSAASISRSPNPAPSPYTSTFPSSATSFAPLASTHSPLASTSTLAPAFSAAPAPASAKRSPSISSKSPSTISKPSPAPTKTVPLRACCPECGPRADAWGAEECFSRGAQRVRRRAESSPLLPGTLFGSAYSPGAGGGLLSGTGLREVNRLVAELEARRTPSPRPAALEVDEVERERRRRSLDLGAISALRTAVAARCPEEQDEGECEDGNGECDEDAEGDPDEADGAESEELLDGVARLSRAGSVRTPSPIKTTPSHSHTHRTYNCPPDDDDDAELFPLPSRGSTPRSSPHPSATPQPSPAGSESQLDLGAHRASPKLDGSPRILSDGSPRLDGERERECREKEKERERERSRSEAVCVALGSMAARQRERERERGTDRCKRGLLMPPGEQVLVLEEEACTDGQQDAGDKGDQEKPLPVLPRLAASVLAAGPYSPALPARGGVFPASAAPNPQASAGSSSSSHLRVASAPAPAVSSPSHAASARSASSSSPRSPPPSSFTAAPPPPPPSLRRASSFARLRSPSTSSTGGRKLRPTFGALVDVLKGVTSISGGSGVSV